MASAVSLLKSSSAQIAPLGGGAIVRADRFGRSEFDLLAAARIMVRDDRLRLVSVSVLHR
jgi:hypothetical protein